MTDYCQGQGDETGWCYWNLVRQHASRHRFVEPLPARRALRKMDSEGHRLGLNPLLRPASDKAILRRPKLPERAITLSPLYVRDRPQFNVTVIQKWPPSYGPRRGEIKLGLQVAPD